MRTCLAAVLLCVTAAFGSETGTLELDAGFDDLVAQLLNLFRVPGLSLAVIKDGKITSKVCSMTDGHDGGRDPRHILTSVSRATAMLAFLIRLQHLTHYGILQAQPKPL